VGFTPRGKGGRPAKGHMLAQEKLVPTSAAGLEGKHSLATERARATNAANQREELIESNTKEKKRE